MKYLSTSALAKQRDLDSKELFITLSEKGWIYKKDDQWIIAKEGRVAGRLTILRFPLFIRTLKVEIFSTHRITQLFIRTFCS